MRTTVADCLAVLLDGGAHIDAVDNVHQTALFLATQSADPAHSAAATRLLLERGASLDILGASHGVTAVRTCFETNRAGALWEVLRYGPDCSVRSSDGSVLLHAAMRSAEGPTLDVLTAAVVDVGGQLDLDLADNGGVTPRALAIERGDKNPELQGPLQRLVKALDDFKGTDRSVASSL
jgi:ankyrin repeat protein